MQTNDRIAISVTEASQILGVSKPTMYKLIHTEGFPVLHIGRRTLIHRGKMEEWCANRVEAQE